MPQSQVLKSFLGSDLPRNIRLMAARGVAPLAPNEMFQVLVLLAGDADPEVAAQAKLTLRDFPEEEVVARVGNRDCSAEVLTYFASAPGQSEAVLEAVILSSATPDRTIEALALTVSGHLLERILDNRIRLLNAPGILDNIKRNKSSPPEVRRLVQEIELEFFGGKKRDYALAETEAESPSPSDSVYLQPEAVPDDLSLEGLPIDPQEREAALTTRIARMSVRQKIQQALLGTREARTILIRDANKEVARSVLQSPKLSENEIETYASMRNVSDDILREIGNSKEWTRGYGVVHSLIKNPKTPPMVSQRLMFRLHSKDLALLARDRGIPEAVRRSAHRALSQRSH